MKTLSVIVACYNERDSIREVCRRVETAFDHIPYDFELIFVDNASTDGSEAVFREVVERDRRIRALIMSRNFGSSQPSILAGMRAARGAAAIILDGDLQDPPELIPRLARAWEDGAEVVYAVRTKRKGSILRRIGYKCFYRLFRWISYIDVPLDAGDFCLMDRRVIDILVSLPEKDLYIRGLRAWVGFRQVGIEYVRDNRMAGKTSCGFWRNFFWAKKAIINFSYKPLEFISRIAMLMLMGTLVTMVGLVIASFYTAPPRGITTVLVVVMALGSVQLLALSILAEYIARIFEEVKNRPSYIIRSELRQEGVIDKTLLPHTEEINMFYERPIERER